MRKLLLFIIIQSVFLSYSFAQNLDWAIRLESSYYDHSECIAVDPIGNIYVSGYYSGFINDFDPGVEDAELDYNDENDVYIGKYDSLGNMIWIRSINGPLIEETAGVVLDHDNNIYLIGKFAGTVDLDPGPGLYTVEGDESNFSEFILKLDSAGNTIWVQAFVGETYFVPHSITMDIDEQIYIFGGVGGDIDIDPGPGVFMLNEVTDGDSYVQKIDTDGNFLWATQFHDGDTYSPFIIRVDNEKNIYLGGTFLNTLDGDPGPGVHEITSAGDEDIYIAKWDSLGNFIWIDNAGGVDEDELEGLEIGSSGDIYISGNFAATCDFDPGAATANLISNGYGDCFFAKYDNDGIYQWAHGYGGNLPDYAHGMCIDASENIYLTGAIKNTVDFDPGPSVYNLSAYTSADAYIAKFNNVGNFISVVAAKASGGAYGYQITLDADQDIIVHGVFSSGVDFDPSDDEFNLTGGYYPSYFQDVFVWKLNQDICANMAIVVDSVAEVNCDNTGYAGLHAIGGATPYQYEWNTVPVINDSIIEFDASGIYTITVQDANLCSRHTSFLINEPTTSGIDNHVSLIIEGFMAGFDAEIWVDGYNSGCTPSTGILQCILDSMIQYNDAIPPPDYISEDTLQWFFSDLTFDSAHLQPQIFVTCLVEPLEEYFAHTEASILPLIVDVDPSNNFFDLDIEVFASFDPNEKYVYPPGACDNGYILNDQPLTYTIVFQNTGTAPAVNINVVDSLPLQLDINSLKIITSSHDMYTEVLDGNAVKFVFPEIYLPDSTSDEPNSHGFVVFEIEPLPALPNGTLIENSSAIYFDFNDPVITNSVSNMIIDIIPYDSVTQNINLCAGESIVVGENSYSVSGTYTDHLKSLEGCDSTVITMLNINPAYAISINDTICSGEIYLFGDDELSTSGIYSDLFNTTGGCDSAVELILVVEDLDASVSSTATMLTANLSGATYQWLDCNNEFSPISGATTQSFSPTESGSYAVVINFNDCTDTSACTTILLNDIEQLSNSNIQLYPNPAHNEIHIVVEASTTQMNAQIYNINGDLMLELNTLHSGENNIDISLFPQGVYFIRLMDLNITRELMFEKR